MGYRKEVQAKGIDNILNKITVENFSNLEKKRVIQRQEVFRTPNRHDQKRNSLRYIIVTTLNIYTKERLLKAARAKQQVIHNGKPSRITDFSTET
jgi:hypothetical protein